jgi:2'-5' RNA ligase
MGSYCITQGSNITISSLLFMPHFTLCQQSSTRESFPKIPSYSYMRVQSHINMDTIHLWMSTWPIGHLEVSQNFLYHIQYQNFIISPTLSS